jgi:hypothetical protein
MDTPTLPATAPSPSPDALAALRQLTLAEVEQRLADLAAERAALSLLRRSLAARDRARRRAVFTKESPP